MAGRLASPTADRPAEADEIKLGSLVSWLYVPVDVASLVVFRIAFGLLMLWEIFRYLDNGWVARYWIEPTFYFTYEGFHWVRPWPGEGMYFHFLILGVLAACIAVGLFYRLSAFLFCLGFTYVFLLDKSPYLNHFYLICLVSFLMVFIPANRALSLDAYFRESLRADSLPAWCLYLIQFQIGIVYFYGGIAKLNGDWLRGEPMRAWLAARVTDFPLIGRFFIEEPVVYLFSYGGLLLDLLIVPLLIWKRSRPFAFAGALFFHVMNARLFTIGVFPWFMIAATTLFFSAGWPRTIFRFPEYEKVAPPAPGPAIQAITGGLLAVWVLAQCVIPLRHYAIPGNVSWTEEGHRFSWHMKLRDKRAVITFYVTDLSTRSEWEIDIETYLAPHQRREMETRPDMIRQFGHHIADSLRAEGYEDIAVHTAAYASLNGREYQLLIDPRADLALLPPQYFGPAWWIEPLIMPLPPP